MILPDSVKTAAHRIASLGHEIGLHSNATTWGIVLERQPADILHEVLVSLRKAGFDVRGTAAHGDSLRNQIAYYNTEAYEEANRAIVQIGEEREIAIEAAPLYSYGLAYDCDFILPRVYLCDSGGNWGYGSSKTLDEVREEFPYDGVQLHALLHPQWWNLGVPHGRQTFGTPDLVEWETFLDQTAGVVPMLDVALGDRDPMVIGLRHDVDVDLENAVLMAEWEADRGYRSTYFLLMGAEYWPGPTPFDRIHWDRTNVPWLRVS